MAEPKTALIELIDKIEQLGQFQDRIDSPATVDQIWDVFLADIRNLIEIEVCALFLVEEGSQEFILQQAAPKDKGKLCRDEINYQIECDIFSWIVKRRQPALIPALVFKNVNSIVMLPLATVRRTLGVILVVTPIQESFITQENLKLMGILAKQCSLVMENSLLYDGLRNKHLSLEKANKEIRYLSETDPLTGCYNRGYMNTHLPREIKRAARYKHSFSLAMCDLDHFKKINDRYGHQCGDDVLKLFVETITEVIRTDSDWLARYGGEEFLLVLPETTIQNAYRLAERLRIEIAQKTIKTRGEKIKITASFGLTGFTADKRPKTISPETLINTADMYLYRAKREGRNKVVSGPYMD